MPSTLLAVVALLAVLYYGLATIFTVGIRVTGMSNVPGSLIGIGVCGLLAGIAGGVGVLCDIERLELVGAAIAAVLWPCHFWAGRNWKPAMR